MTAIKRCGALIVGFSRAFRPSGMGAGHIRTNHPDVSHVRAPLGLRFDIRCRAPVSRGGHSRRLWPRSSPADTHAFTSSSAPRTTPSERNEGTARIRLKAQGRSRPRRPAQKGEHDRLVRLGAKVQLLVGIEPTTFCLQREKRIEGRRLIHLAIGA
jgi:hypothetical protein